MSLLSDLLERLTAELVRKALLVIVVLILGAFASYFPIISTNMCSLIRFATSIPCHVIGYDKALRFSNVYKIEGFENHFPGATSATAKTDDGTKVWTSFTRVVPDNKPPRDHIIYAIVERKHLEGSSCILLYPGIWPPENQEEKTSSGWEHTFIILTTNLLKQDEERENPIILKPLDQGASETRVEFYVNGSESGGLRGVLGESCLAAKKRGDFSNTQAYSLIKKANAQSENVSRNDRKKNKIGWSYIGLFYENSWITKYLDVNITIARENLRGELQYIFRPRKKATALGNVNLREGHILLLDGKWVNQKKIGVVCKDQAINVIELKRVARVADTSEEYDEEEFDGYWWAKVSGDIRPTCEKSK